VPVAPLGADALAAISTALAGGAGNGALAQRLAAELQGQALVAKVLVPGEDGALRAREQLRESLLSHLLERLDPQRFSGGCLAVTVISGIKGLQLVSVFRRALMDADMLFGCARADAYFERITVRGWACDGARRPGWPGCGAGAQQLAALDAIDA
jgi:hypothetical protein